ncbi:MAG: translesion DNA synthesis-associated protein ImuA [Lysobacteraceae bacterium]
MGTVVSLAQGLAEGRVFRGGRGLQRHGEGQPSGLPALDAALPWGGFPRGALTELLVPADGVGELELLLPALAAVCARERIALVAPPYLPYAPALARAGLALDRVDRVQAPPARAAWAAEHCLRAGCFGAVLCWLHGGDERVLRRLQVAAADGAAFGFVLRPARQAANPSPAALRLRLRAEPGHLALDVLKSRGAQPPVGTLRRPRRH